MTKTIFITGDRSMDPFTAVQIAGVIIGKIHLEANAKQESLRFMTGNAKTGIERAVRYLIPEQVIDIVSYDINADGKPEFDEIHKIIATEIDEVWFLHPDPLSSRIGKSLHQHFSHLKIKMPLQEL